ncbi:MAG: TlyA family RNA methyltransferase [Deltaproteobacteria bacterium]|nr:TlyA family RNA methyltransferase [Deltaproteobacteria bacterium]
MGKGGKVRIDRLLVERGLCPSRARAQARIMAGEVIVNGHRVEKAGTEVPEDAELRLKGEDLPFVSRGGLKLQGALEAFGFDPTGLRCIDLGASTGGFTDCLLQAGAASVVAVDVGYGQLAAKLRADPRVEVHERTNARLLKAGDLGEPADLVVVDCSFISLELLLPVAALLLKPAGSCLPLVKPQFEVGREAVGKGGVVRDEAARRAALARVRAFAESQGFAVRGEIVSPLKGPKGNVEYLLWLERSP